MKIKNTDTLHHFLLKLHTLFGIKKSKAVLQQNIKLPVLGVNSQVHGTINKQTMYYSFVF